MGVAVAVAVAGSSSFGRACIRSTVRSRSGNSSWIERTSRFVRKHKAEASMLSRRAVM